MGLFYLSNKHSFFITGFNLDSDNNLWVTRIDGGSIKVETGELALEMHNALCEIATNTMPCIIHNKEIGAFKINVNMA